MRAAIRVLLLAIAVVALGCGSSNSGGDTKGYEKSDFESKPRPEGYGPPGGAPPTPPPSATTGG